MAILSPALWRVWLCRLCQVEAKALEREGPRYQREVDRLLAVGAQAFDDGARAVGASTESSKGRFWREGMARLREKPVR